MNEQFDEKYYNDIWGTVHRHDYCDDLASRLINKYDPKSVLDIGTGCGYLVQVLRDRGVEAWGLEVSDYAVENSHGFVVKGDVRGIPFASGKFDLVFSQGLWGYFPEEDIEKAWNECKRVGKEQLHHIDYNDYEPIHKYLFTHDEQWWKDKFYPRVLVACPTHKVKDYAWKRWVENVKNLTYPNYDILIVDNSVEKLEREVPTIHLPLDIPQAMLRITKSMEVIRQHFLKGNYKYWMNIESDIIPPKDIIEQLMKYGQNSDWISHAYPTRGAITDDQQGIGCSLLSKKLMQDFNFDEAGDNSPDGWLWQRVKPLRKYKVMELWGYFPVEHLKEKNGS